MAPWVTQLIVTNIIQRIKEKRMKKFLKGAKWTSVLALVIGSVTGVFGVDLAPEQIDTLVNAGAILVYVVTEVLENRKAQTP